MTGRTGERDLKDEVLDAVARIVDLQLIELAVLRTEGEARCPRG